MRPYDATQQLDELDEYASVSTNKEIPSTVQYEAGVEAGYTLPAKWWNWFMSKLTLNEFKAAQSIQDLYAELLSVLEALEITPNEGQLQLLSALTRLFYGEVSIVSTNRTLDASKSHIERLVIDTEDVVISLPALIGTETYRGAHIFNASAGDITVGTTLVPSGTMCFVYIINGDWSTHTIHLASSAPVSQTNILRDTNGRAKTIDPIAEDDIATKKTVMDYYRGDTITGSGILPLNKMITVVATGVIDLTLPNDAEEGNYILLNAVTACQILASTGQDIIDARTQPYTIKETCNIAASKSHRLQYLGNVTAKTEDVIIPVLTPFNIANNSVDVAWSPNGRYLAVAHYSSPYIIIYDWSSGSPIKIPDPATLPTGAVGGVAWSPNGRYLAVGHYSSPYIIIYDWNSGSPIKIPDPADLPTDGVGAVAWSPDGRYLAVGYYSSPYIIIYDWSSGSPIKIPDPATLPTGAVGGVAWSPNGRYLVVGHDSSPYITIYDWDSGSPVKIPNPATLPTGAVGGAAWSPNGRYLAVAHSGSSPYITIYDWDSGSPIKIPNPADLPSGQGNDVAWSPNGRYLAVAHSGSSPYITIYDWNSGSPVKIPNPATLPSGSGTGVAWSPDGRYLVVSCWATLSIIIYDWDSGSPVKIPDPATLPAGGVSAVAWSPDGRYLAALSAIPRIYDVYLTVIGWVLI